MGSLIKRLLAALCARRRYLLALRKREMEQALRAQGHSAGYAKAVTAARFREQV